jgi:hypothetical protein
MDLLDRYVSAVKTYLPADQQDDIGKELSANIQSEMDDREAALGRPLSEAEQEAILQQHGHPMVLAGRYRPSQGSLVFGRQWIGPTLFPFYLRTLQVVIGISFAIYLSVLGALIIIGQQVTFGGVMNTLLLQIFWLFASVTLIFAAVDHYVLPTMRWDARKPPALQPVMRNVQQVPRLESVVQIVGIVVFLIWAWFVVNNPTPVFGPVTGTYRLGPIWQQVALPVVLILLVGIAQAVVNLFRPDWTRFQMAVRLLTDLAVLGILAYLLRGDQWVVLAHPNGAGAAALDSLNQYVSYGLLIVLVGSAFVLLTDAWKLVRGEQRRQPLRAAGAEGL